MTNLGCATGILIFGASYAGFLYLVQHEIATALLTGLVTASLWVLFYGGPVALSLLSQWRAGRRADELRQLHLEVDDEEIRQVDQSGVVRARILLTEPFQFHDLHREDDDAIYRLYQGEVELDFHTSDPESERILTDILGLSWPPRAMRIST
jgi:hypothetical protein